MLLYILIAVVVYLAVSQTMYPALTNSQTKEVSYSDFLTMVDKNEVTQVQKTQGDAQLYFTTGSGDSQQKYSTVIFGSGDGLNEKLEAMASRWWARSPTPPVTCGSTCCSPTVCPS